MNGQNGVGLDGDRTALVIIDMQNDFCSPGGYSDRHSGPEAIERIQAMIPTLQQLSDGAHGKVSVVRVRTNYSTPWLSRPNRERMDRRGIDPYCVPDSWGFEFVEGLEENPGDLIVEKHTFSAFWDTPLDHLLRARDIRTVAFAGVYTNVCIDTSVRDAFCRGYSVVTLSDCVETVTDDEQRVALKTLETYFGPVWTSQQFLDALA